MTKEQAIVLVDEIEWDVAQYRSQLNDIRVAVKDRLLDLFECGEALGQKELDLLDDDICVDRVDLADDEPARIRIVRIFRDDDNRVMVQHRRVAGRPTGYVAEDSVDELLDLDTMLSVDDLAMVLKAVMDKVSETVSVGD